MIRGWFTEIPSMAWPGWYPYPGIWFGGPYLSFGMGFGIGFFGGFGWGWGHWGFNWGGRFATFGGGRYYSRSNTFYNRNAFYRGGGSARRSFQPRWRHARRWFRTVSARGPVLSTETHRAARGFACTPRSERTPLRRLQRLRAWRTGKELFVTRKVQLRGRRISWRRWISRRRRRISRGGGRR